VNHSRQLSLAALDPPNHPSRLDYDETEIAALADSMRDVGLINPILVEPNGERFTIIAGDQRVRAARLLGWTHITATTHEPTNHHQTTQLRLAENLQRSDLSPIEEARELYRLQHDHHLTTPQIARLVRRREPWVDQRLALLQLPDDLGPLVHTRRMAIAGALALARCDDERHRNYLTQYAINEGASAHTIAMWVESWRVTHDLAQSAGAPPPPLFAPSGAPVVYMQCSTCHGQFPHTDLRIARHCDPCLEILNQPTPAHP